MKRFILTLALLSHLPIVQTEARQAPRMPYHDWGTCPFECCIYRDWTTTGDVIAYKGRSKKSGIAFRLASNETVQAVTGVVITYRAGIVKVLQPIQLGYLPGKNQQQLSFRPGERIHTLHQAGEGHEVFWYRGRTYSDELAMPTEELQTLSHPRYRWWAKIRNQAGQEGWTPQTDRFSNKDDCG